MNSTAFAHESDIIASAVFIVACRQVYLMKPKMGFQTSLDYKLLL